MITAVDTNVLLDIFGADLRFGTRSADALRRCLEEGALCACEVVWAETVSLFPDSGACLKAMHAIGVDFSPMTRDAALKAADAWRRYRAKGGKRDRVVADFLIGSHALSQCDRLLTSDRGFYREYFGRLRVIDPSA